MSFVRPDGGMIPPRKRRYPFKKPLGHKDKLADEQRKRVIARQEQSLENEKSAQVTGGGVVTSKTIKYKKRMKRVMARHLFRGMGLLPPNT